MTAPRILRLEEKHNTRHIALIDDDLNKTAAAIIRERWNDGYWYPEPTFDPPYRGNDKELLANTREDTPESLRAVRDKAQERLDGYTADHSRVTTEWDALRKIGTADTLDAAANLRTNRGRGLAEFMLRHRKGYEYEGWTVIEPETLT